MDLFKDTFYSNLKEDINAMLLEGIDSIENAYRRQLIVTNWNIGKRISFEVKSDCKRSKELRRIVQALAHDFNKNDEYFYKAIKFYRLYSELPRDDCFTWRHYLFLMAVKDDKMRKFYETQVKLKKLSSYRLRDLITSEKFLKKQQLNVQTSNHQLQVFRGELYTYIVKESKLMQSNKKQILLDIGFNFFKEVSSAEKRLHGGHCASTFKNNSEYGISRVVRDKNKLYTYKAKVNRVVDADTFVLNVNCGFALWTEVKVRLRGINCPEISTAQGVLAKKYVVERLAKVDFVIVKTYSQGKFGRFIADIFYLPNENSPDVVAKKGQFLNQELLDNSYADFIA